MRHGTIPGGRDGCLASRFAYEGLTLAKLVVWFSLGFPCVVIVLREMGVWKPWSPVSDARSLQYTPAAKASAG